MIAPSVRIWPSLFFSAAGFAGEFKYTAFSPFTDNFSDKLNWAGNEVPGNGDRIQIERADNQMVFNDLPSTRRYESFYFQTVDVQGNAISSARITGLFSGRLRHVIVRDAPSLIETLPPADLTINNLVLNSDVTLQAFGNGSGSLQASSITVTGPISGAGAISVETGKDSYRESKVLFTGANSFTGPVIVREGVELHIFQSSGLGSTGVGTEIEDDAALLIDAGASPVIGEALNVDGILGTIYREGAAGEVTLTGSLDFDSRSTLMIGAPLKLTGVLNGGMTLRSAAPFGSATPLMTVAGTLPNTLGTAIRAIGVDLLLDKPAGVNAVAGLKLDSSSTVRWGSDRQIAGGAISVGFGCVADLDDHDEIVSSVGMRGLVTTGNLGTLRIDRRIGGTGGKIQGRLLAGSADLEISAEIDGELAATITPAVADARMIVRGRGLLKISGVSSVPAHLSMGTLEVNSNSPLMPVTVDESTLNTLNPSGSIIVAHPAILAGTGTMGTLTVAEGILAPGSNGTGILRTKSFSIGKVSATEPVAFFKPEIHGPAVGTEYDQLKVTGTVSIAGSDLNLETGFFEPVSGQSFTIIDNDGTDPVVGIFNGFPQGSTVYRRTAFVNSIGVVMNYVISYTGGTGNDVVLTVVAAPSGVTRTWTGAGADANWKTMANWSPAGAPEGGDSLVFPASAARRTNINNIVNLPLHSISLAGAAYQISGNPISLTGGITVASSVLTVHTIDLPLFLTSAQSMTTASSSLSLTGDIETNGVPVNFVTNGSPSLSRITCSGVISGGAGEQLVKQGNGMLTLGNANTTRGNFRIIAGTVRITHEKALGSRLGVTLVEDGAQLLVAGTDLDINEPLQLAGTMAIADNAGAPVYRGSIHCADTARLVVSAVGVPQFTMFDEFSGTLLTKAGAGKLLVGGAKPKSLTGGFNVAEGRLTISGTAGVLALPGTTTVGTATTTGILEIIQRRTTDETSHILVNPGSSVICDSQEISFPSLTLNGGTVTTDANGFTLNGPLVVLPAAVSSVLSGNIILAPGRNSWTVADGPAAVDLRVEAVVREAVLTDALLIKDGEGSTLFTAANTLDHVRFQAGVNTWNSVSPNTDVTAAAGTVQGTGRADILTGSTNGNVAPGNGPGVFTVDNILLSEGGTLRFELNGASPGTGYDQIRCLDASAPVNLSAGRLALSHGYPAVVGEVFTLIDVPGTSAVIPSVAQPEGAIILAGTRRYRLSYLGGTGNDVTVTLLGGVVTETLAFSQFQTISGSGATRVFSGKVTGGSGGAGLNIQMEGSTDLAEWVPLGGFVADSAGSVAFEFVQAASQPRFFVRARLPQISD